MSEVYVVKNQDGYFASKKKEWLDGRDPKALFRSPHKDEAINMVFELSSKDIHVRAVTELVELNDKKFPIVEVTVPLVEVEPEETEELTEHAPILDDEPIAEESESSAPKELTSSERLSLMAARMREQEESNA
ncbi:MAG: hypothetical protein ACJA0N_001808 [Pseudohongiellaceae bacterium]|jgi:hypothetical protein